MEVSYQLNIAALSPRKRGPFIHKTRLGIQIISTKVNDMTQTKKYPTFTHIDI